MTLDIVNTGEECRLVFCGAPDKTRSKLEALGLVPGASIKIIQRTRAGIILEIKRSRLAIAHDLASYLTVSQITEDESACVSL